MVTVSDSGYRTIPGQGSQPTSPIGSLDCGTYNFGNFEMSGGPRTPSCTPGTFYSVSSNGTLVEVVRCRRPLANGPG